MNIQQTLSCFFSFDGGLVNHVLDVVGVERHRVTITCCHMYSEDRMKYINSLFSNTNKHKLVQKHKHISYKKEQTVKYVHNAEKFALVIVRDAAVCRAEGVCWQMNFEVC